MQQSTRTPRRWLAIILNILSAPWGYYYLKMGRRFIISSLVFQLVPWLLLALVSQLPESTYAWPHLSLLGFMFLFVIGIIIDTWKVSKIPSTNPSNFFSKPHAWYVVPCVLALFYITSSQDKAVTLSGSAHSIPSGSMSPSILPGDYIYVTENIETSQLQRGDMISFEPVGSGSRKWLMRLIALPGDQVVITQSPFGKNLKNVLRVSINSKLLGIEKNKKQFTNHELDELRILSGSKKEDYVQLVENNHGRTYLIQESAIGDSFVTHPEARNKFTVPARKYFVLGDSRDNSRDSRYIGLIDAEQIVSTYMYTYMSINWHDKTCPELSEQNLEKSFECPNDWMSRWKRAEIRWDRIGKKSL